MFNFENAKVLTRVQQKNVKGGAGSFENCHGIARCYATNGEGGCGTCEEWLALPVECRIKVFVDYKCAGR